MLVGGGVGAGLLFLGSGGGGVVVAFEFAFELLEHCGGGLVGWRDEWWVVGVYSVLVVRVTLVWRG